MKFNFKKIASVLTGAVMLSSTVALAAAANFPAPFVKSGAGDFAVVYGSGTSLTDGVAAANINSWLNAKVTTATPQTNVTLTGENVPLFKSNNRLHLGSPINAVVDDVDYNKFPTVLAQEVFTDDDGTEYNYDQKIYIGGDLGTLNLTHFANTKVNADKTPVIGYDVTSDQELIDYEVSFSDALVNSSSLVAGNSIKLLGKEWYISKVENTGSKITLLDTTNEVTMTEGATQTVTVGSKSYEITVDSIEDTGDGKATFKIGSNSYSILEGNSKKIDSDPDTYIAVTNVVYSDKKDSKVTFTVGSGDVILENGVRVKVNGDSVNGLTTAITKNSGDEITKINVVWAPTDDTFLVPGKELVLPAFGGVKLSYTGFTFGTEEAMTVGYDGDDVIDLENLELTDGTLDSLPVIYRVNDTSFEGLGTDAETVLATNNDGGDGSSTLDLVLAENPTFVATWVSAASDEWETHVFQLTDIVIGDDTNETTIADLVDTSADDYVAKITGSDQTPNKDFGEINLQVSDANETSVTITVTPSSGSGDVYTDKVLTKGGLSIDLPVLADVAAATSYDFTFTEADKEPTANAGSTFTVSVGAGTSSEGVQVTSTDPSGIKVNKDSDDKEAYVPGDMATKILYKGSEDRPTADITYHTTESYANVYIAEAGAASSGNGGGSSGWLPVKDSEVSGVQSKNLLVVGGSCVNTVAAKLLGSDTPLCEQAWMTASKNVGAGSFLIKTFANPWATTKVATLVAGYDAADTENAVNALKLQDVDTTAGKEYVGRAGAALTLVT